MARRETRQRPPGSPPNQVWLGNIPLRFKEDDVVREIRSSGLPDPKFVKLLSNPRHELQYCFVTFNNQREADGVVEKGNEFLRWEEDGPFAEIQVDLFCNI